MTIVKVKTLDHFDSSFGPPKYQTSGSAGADIKVSLPEDEREKGFTIKANERCLIPTGLSFEIPQGYEIQVRPRSGLSLKTPLLVVNSPGTIDSDYRGEVKILIGNFGNEDWKLEHGERIAQIVLAQVPIADFRLDSDLSETKRGDGGFGSTGVQDHK